MAAFFLEEYIKGTNEKIVCWMATYHAIRNSSIIEGVEKCCKDNAVIIMGEIINKKYPVKFTIYSLLQLQGNME